MNVKELKELLSNFPDEMEVVVWDKDRGYDRAENVKVISHEESFLHSYINGLGPSSYSIKSFLLIAY